MATILDENNPIKTQLAGEQDDHMRSLKSRIASLFRIGHILEDPPSINDGQLKFGERVKSDYAGSGNVVLQLSEGTVHVINMTGSVSLTFSDPPDDGSGSPVAGFGFVLILKQNGTGGNVASFPSSVKWVNGASFYQNTSSFAETHYSFYTVNGCTTLYGMVIGDFNA